jgi:hypothetical protein
MTDQKEWKTFEDAARSIIANHREFFGLEEVEPSVTKVQGTSGYQWNIDVVGYAAGSRKIVIFEVRRKKRNIVPEEIAGLAYRIEDTGSEKGYIVTRMDRGLSTGAEGIAGYEEIGHIRVSKDATPEFYLMQCLDKIFVRVVDKFDFSDMKDSLRLLVQDKDGNTVREISEKELDAGKVDFSK